MNWSVGCAFSFNDIIMNFPLKSLKSKCADAFKAIGDNHRNILMRRIFIYNVRQVINDIIDNNVTFWLPLNGKVKCNMHMKAFRGKAFKSLRKGGKWKGLDIVNSMFTGYMISFYMFGLRTPRIKSVYLGNTFNAKIIANSNKGMAYGDGKTDTTINDYYPEIYKAFPDISKTDIHKILKFCWKAIYLHNSYGGDTLIVDKELWWYIGNLKKDPIQHFEYYKRKLSIKLRILYRRKKIPWDGYYYFALTDKLYEYYMSLKSKKGRPKKWFHFKNVFFYLIYDECSIRESARKYLFRVPFISYVKFKFYKDEFTTDKAELIKVREPLKFKDIMVDLNYYECI